MLYSSYIFPIFSTQVSFDVIDMPMDWTVDVNYHDAKVYCRWKGAEFRLPTEAEHVTMRGHEV